MNNETVKRMNKTEMDFVNRLFLFFNFPRNQTVYHFFHVKACHNTSPMKMKPNTLCNIAKIFTPPYK